MSIEKRTYTSSKTGKIHTSYRACVWSPAEGRKIHGRFHKTEKAARQDETDIQRAIDSGTVKPSKTKKITVSEVFKEWSASTKPPVLANSTWHIYSRFYNDYISDVFGARAVCEVQTIHVQKYVNLMAEKYSPETVNKCVSILSDIFSFAVNVLHCIDRNPAQGIRRCKVPTKSKVVWSDEQIVYFLSLPEVMDSHYYPMLCLSAALGPRPGEVCGLKETSLLTDPCYMIDFNRGYDNHECATDLKTRGSYRTPPIPQYLYRIIHKRLLWKKELRLEFPDWGANNYLFVSPIGVPIKPKQYARAFKRLLLKHNETMENYLASHGELPPDGQILPYLTLYGFRTSFATNAMRKHPNAALVSSIMGNSVKTLLQFYTQSDTDMQSQLINDYVQLKNAASE